MPRLPVWDDGQLARCGSPRRALPPFPLNSRNARGGNQFLRNLAHFSPFCFKEAPRGYPAEAFHSYTEPHLATDNELVRNILLALLSSLAKLEAQKISERTKAGMARAKANGIKIGRPKLEIEIRQKIMQRAKKGETPYAIAKALRIDRHTAAKYAQSRA